MSGVIDKYAFSLFLDSKGFAGGANLALTSLNGLTKGFGVAALALAGIDLFGGMLKTYNDLSTGLGRTSEITGESVKDLEAWRITVRDSGGDVNAFTGTIKGLNADMANFATNGESKTLPVFARLGIGVRKSNGELKKGSELLQEFAKVQSRFGEREAMNFAQQLGIDEGTFIAIRRAGKDIDGILGRNRKLAVVNQGDVRLMEQMNALSSQFKQMWDALAVVLMREALPVLRDEIKPALEAFVKYLIDHKEDIKAFFKGAWETAKELWSAVKPIFEFFKNGIKDIVNALGGWDKIATGIKITFETIKGTIIEIAKWISWILDRASEGAGIFGNWFGSTKAGVGVADFFGGAGNWVGKAANWVSDKVAGATSTRDINVGDIIVHTQATTPDGIGAAVKSNIQGMDLKYNAGAA